MLLYLIYVSRSVCNQFNPLFFLNYFYCAHNYLEALNMSKNIDYGTLMHKAMRTLIFDVLKDVEKNGLPGEHHFL